MTKRLLFAALAIASISTAATAAGAQTVVVKEDDVLRQLEGTPPTNEWMIYKRAGTGEATFVSGPEQPPLGVGSLTLTTPTGTDKIFAFNFEHVGTALADIDAMGYSTYRTSGSLQQVTALNMVIDFNGAETGGFATLVFEPVYNTDQGAVVSGEWQNWDAYKGGQARWWSTRDMPGVCAFTCYVSWATIVQANPQATVSGGYGVNQGSGNPGLTTSVDALRFGASGEDVTYDFEPTLRPSSKDECKNEGFRTFNSPAFKNQGQCVSFVNGRR